ncbi:MAG TPA: tetratricopeptide repeat protein [Verrucomicrobiae bacterium]|nr:tetratricopeptide repeat protein [Verrucomicrobiae bacterium]
MRLALLLLSGSLAFAQQPKQQQRDLKIEKVDETVPSTTGFSIPRSYAVIVGISHYKNLPANMQLQYAERDAQAIYTILISAEGGNFKAENVRLLTGEKATLAGLRAQIDTWLPGISKSDDRVLIYFAGHGFLFGGKGYLAPYDFDSNRVAETGFPMDELGSVMGGKIQAKSKVLLTDACHSGAISPEDTENLNQRLTNLNKSLFSLTASRAREQSFESPDLRGGHGVFTYYVVTGMEGEADTSGDGVVTADELAEYVHTQVRDYTSGKQNPTSDKSNYDPEMPLAYIPSHAKPAAAPAQKFGTLIFESNMDDVELFIDGQSRGVLQKGKSFAVPGLAAGEHTIKAVHSGYEPDGPRQQLVYPGREDTVSIKILIPRRRNKAAADLLDEGIKEYHKGNEQGYRKAAEVLDRALQVDSNYSQAAFYQGLAYSALFDYDKAKAAYEKAIAIDPGYLEAHANLAGMLLDVGDVDSSIRHLNLVLQRQPDHAVALTLLAQAYRFKDLYPESIAAARRSIALNPKTAESHLWLADSLRLSGKLDEAPAEYQQYLKLSDFDSKLGGKLNYYVLGSLFAMGRKKRVAERDIWNDYHNMAYYGLCECERRTGKLDEAIRDCQRALTFDPKDFFSHYTLGLAFMTKANKTQSIAELDPALRHFQTMIALAPDVNEAKYARKNIAAIEEVLKQVK